VEWLTAEIAVKLLANRWVELPGASSVRTFRHLTLMTRKDVDAQLFALGIDRRHIDFDENSVIATVDALPGTVPERIARCRGNP
jgi:hypothetical protein